MPPKTTRRYRQGDESRERILQASLELASERGYDGMTLGLVRERTGLPASSIYWHFAGKDALLAEVVEYSFAQWQDSLQSVPVRGDDTLEARIRERMEITLRGLSQSPQFWRLGLILVLTRLEHEAARERFLQIRRGSLATVVASWTTLIPEPALSRIPALPTLLTQVSFAISDGLFIAAHTDRRWDYPALISALGSGYCELIPRLADLPSPSEPIPFIPHPKVDGLASDDPRIRLISAASQIAAERGYVGTSVSRICERSGLDPGSLYWHFQDKDALLAEVVRHSEEEWARTQPQWEPVVGEAARRATLLRILRSVTQGFLDAPDFLRLGFLLTLAKQDDEPSAKALCLTLRNRAETQVRAWFAHSLSDDQQPADRELAIVLARLWLAIVDGLVIAEQAGDWDWDFDALCAVGVELIESVITAYRREHRLPSS